MFILGGGGGGRGMTYQTSQCGCKNVKLYLVLNLTDSNITHSTTQEVMCLRIMLTECEELFYSHW